MVPPRERSWVHNANARAVSDMILLVTIIPMALGIFTELRDMLVMHCVARAKILASQARINPVSHPRERLPLPVSNESPMSGDTASPRCFPCVSIQFLESARMFARLLLPSSFSSILGIYDRCTLVGET